MSESEHVPKIASLDGFVDAVEKNQGIGLGEIGAGRTLIVETRNSTYTIHVTNPTKGEVVVTGGKFFPVPEACILSGATWGGANLKMRWVGIGMHMEFHKSSERITTSPVKTISIPGTPSNLVH